jgi:hypothetical protein
VFALLENHYGVDILDEWALLPRLHEFPAVVVPERHGLSEPMVEALRAYVAQGGRLLLSGAEVFDRFGADFVGAGTASVAQKACYHVPADDGAVPLFSEAWRLLKPKQAAPVGQLGRTPLRDDALLPHPAATLNRVGKGRVAYIPAAVFRDFNHNRYPMTRAFIGDVMRRLVGPLPITVHAPTCIDVALRRKNRRTLVHLVNRASGIPNQPNNGAIDEIPAVGPVVITARLDRKPASVEAGLERQPLRWTFAKGRLRIALERVHIHEAVVIG